MGIRESRMARFGCFGHEASFQPTLQGGGKALQQIVVRENVLDIGDGRGIRERRTGSEGSFFPHRDVGDRKSYFLGGTGGKSESAAFHGREMTADSVYAIDGSTACDQRAVDDLKIIEIHRGI